MFIRSEKPYRGLNTTRINIGTYLGEEKDEDAYVVLAEMPIDITIQLREKDAAKNFNELAMIFKEALPRLIVVHNLHETKEELMTAQDVADLISAKSKLMTALIPEYLHNLFPTPPKQNEKK